MENLLEDLGKLGLSEKTKIEKNIEFIKDILESLQAENIEELEEVLQAGKLYELNEVEESCRQYRDIENLFNRTLNSAKDDWEIKSIHEVICPYLLSSYLLKKQMKIEKDEEIDEQMLYHGTAAINIPSICENNFDWRLKGSSTGHIFGQGISFASRSTYACHYPSCSSDNPRIIILTEVMVGESELGDESMIVPNEGYNSTKKWNSDVIVKYDDSEYLPKFIIYYY